MQLIDQFPEGRLTREEETALSKSIQAGSEDAQNQLVIATMRQALLYTQRTSRGTVSDGDRVSLCYQRLMRAAKRFDPARGRFFPFAKAALRGSMKTYWQDQGAVRNAKGMVSLDRLGGWTGSDDGRTTRAGQHAHVKPDIATELGRHSAFILAGGEEEESPGREPLTGEVTPPEFDLIFARDEWAELAKRASPNLDSRHRMVLALIYRGGLNGPEIGKLMGVTRSRIHAIHREALQIIRDTMAPGGRLLNRA
jgi:RNA polymerase sigma factor (sigma-70 family)